jgi:NADPH2:quinone reductase
MRAVLCRENGPIENLRLEQVPDLPPPGPREVVVDVRVAGVNFPDILVVEGKYQKRPALPFVPGLEGAGVAAAVGREVTHVRAGSRVMLFSGLGAFAEQVCAPAHQVIGIPDDLDFTRAAAMPVVYGTAIHALVQRAALAAGETLLVLGASGGVGLAAVQIGKQLGARVIAAAGAPWKLELTRKHGADATIDYSTEPLKERVAELTGKQGVDVVFDPVGGDYTEPAARALGIDGRLLVIGFTAGAIPRLPLNLALLKETSFVGVHWGAFTDRKPQENQRNFERLFGWYQEGKVVPHVHRELPLDQFSTALELIRSRQVAGKVVLKVS